MKIKSLLIKALSNDSGKKLLRTAFGAIQNLGMNVESDYSSRNWSNSELARLGRLFQGDIVNVSGWLDSDRSGSGKNYIEYFPNHTSYTITNYPGMRGLETSPNSIPLDLEKKFHRNCRIVLMLSLIIRLLNIYLMLRLLSIRSYNYLAIL